MDWTEAKRKHDFRSFGAIEPAVDHAGKIMTYAPQSRYVKSSTTPLHAYGDGDFCKFRVKNVPDSMGVYAFTVRDIPMYIGKALNLRKRFTMGYGNISPKNCYVGGQQTNCRINKHVLELLSLGEQIDIWITETPDAALIEGTLIGQFMPAWNRAGKRK